MTATAQRFIDIINTLGPSFRERAPALDREGRFVSDNYRELREHRLLSAAIPEELGGGGASHREMCQVLRQLAHYCPSTALALSMHTHLIAAAVWRHLRGQPGKALLLQVAKEELVLVSTGAGDWVDSVGRAERQGGGYRISAVKRFCSGAPTGDVMLTSCPFEPEAGAAEVLHFAVPLRAQGVRLREDWDTLGMRSTGSQSVELDGVFVPEEAVVLRRPRGVWHAFWNVVVGVAPPLYMAPYVGIAEAAAELARGAALRKPLDAAGTIGLGEVENQLVATQLAWREMLALTDDYAFQPSNEHTSRMLICKTRVANAARATVAKAVELVGGGAYFRANGLERLMRDVEAASFHLLPEKKQLTLSGRVALGLPPV